MSKSTLKVLSFIPIINFFVILYCCFICLKNRNLGGLVKVSFLWMCVMVVFTSAEAIVNMIFYPMEMIILINIFTYLSLYISITIGALLYVRTAI